MTERRGPRTLAKLRGGDRRSIGRVAEVVADVQDNPSLFDELIHGMYDDDPLIRMRAADAVEKLTARRPEWLQRYKTMLIGKVPAIDQQEVRWHVAQMIPRLKLTPKQRAKAAQILTGYMSDESAIVKTFSLQALADLAEADARLRRRVTKLLEEAVQSGPPALRSRAKKLLARRKKT
jgi:hypothetical protein